MVAERSVDQRRLVVIRVGDIRSENIDISNKNNARNVVIFCFRFSL